MWSYDQNNLKNIRFNENFVENEDVSYKILAKISEIYN